MKDRIRKTKVDPLKWQITSYATPGKRFVINITGLNGEIAILTDWENEKFPERTYHKSLEQAMSAATRQIQSETGN